MFAVWAGLWLGLVISVVEHGLACAGSPGLMGLSLPRAIGFRPLSDDLIARVGYFSMGILMPFSLAILCAFS